MVDLQVAGDALEKVALVLRVFGNVVLLMNEQVELLLVSVVL